MKSVLRCLSVLCLETKPHKRTRTVDALMQYHALYVWAATLAAPWLLLF